MHVGGHCTLRRHGEPRLTTACLPLRATVEPAVSIPRRSQTRAKPAMSLSPAPPTASLPLPPPRSATLRWKGKPPPAPRGGKLYRNFVSEVLHYTIADASTAPRHGAQMDQPMSPVPVLIKHTGRLIGPSLVAPNCCN